MILNSLFQINRDPVAAQMHTMRSQIEQLQAELLFYRGDTSGPFEELQVHCGFRKCQNSEVFMRFSSPLVFYFFIFSDS